MRTRVELIERFIKQRQKSDNTKKNEMSDLKQFERYCKENGLVEFRDVKYDDIADFISGLLARDGSEATPATKQRKVSTLKRFYKYLMVNDYADKTPMDAIETPSKGERAPVYLNLEECNHLLDTMESVKYSTKLGELQYYRDIAIVTTFLYVGCRVAEMARLDIKDIKGGKIRLIGKRNKERFVSLMEDAENAINKYLNLREDDNPAMFLNYLGNKMSVSAIQKLTNKYIALAGFEEMGITCHKLRHSCASLLAEGGATALEIKEILGHKDVSTTQIYVHLADETIGKAVAMNPLKRR